jgi:hypothetical protein
VGDLVPRRTSVTDLALTWSSSGLVVAGVAIVLSVVELAAVALRNGV